MQRLYRSHARFGRKVSHRDVVRLLWQLRHDQFLRNDADQANLFREGGEKAVVVAGAATQPSAPFVEHKARNQGHADVGWGDLIGFGDGLIESETMPIPRRIVFMDRQKTARRWGSGKAEPPVGLTNQAGQIDLIAHRQIGHDYT